MTGNETRMGPDDLVGREFAIGLRGYDRDEVDAFLLRAAEAWRESMASTPSITGLSSTAMAALAESEPPPVESFSPPPAAPTAHEAGPSDPFAAPTTPEPDADADADAEQPSPFASEPTPDVTEPEVAPSEAASTPSAPAEPEASTAAPSEPEATAPSRAEVERDRATAYAERVAAELDRASARTELAQAQEEALRVVDSAQRRAEAVLTGARAKAQAEAESILEDARTRLTPLLEQERAVRARLIRLRQDLDSLTDEGPTAAPPTLPSAADLVTSTEDDPATPEATFPVGYGSISVG
jgi:DivIVA domain-containing protein